MTNTHRTTAAAMIGVEALTAFTTEALVAAGATEPDAALVAEVLIAADLAGVDSHGVARLRRYVIGLSDGTIDGSAQPQVVGEQGGVSIVDACNGLGQPALRYAVDLAASRATEHGIAAVAVRRSNHIGIAGWYAERAARSNAFALVTTNATPQVAPAGAAEPMFGTDPVSYAVPTGDQPLCYDGATSVVPRGKLERLYREGQPMLLGWAIGPDGRMVTDLPRVVEGLKARVGYALLPVGGAGEHYGGHKGSGIGLLAELLCGPLAGASWSRHTYGTDGAGLGQFVICLQLNALGDPGAIVAALDAMTAEIRGARRADARTAVRLPGDRRRSCARQRAAEGIPLLPPVVADLVAIAEFTGIAPPALSGVGT